MFPIGLRIEEGNKFNVGCSTRFNVTLIGASEPTEVGELDDIANEK